MRLYSGKKIGQSGYELVLAVFFSFFLHAALVVLALVLVTAVAPKVHIPLFYEVKLVALPADVAPTVAEAPLPEPPKEEPAPVPAPPEPKAKKAEPKLPKPAVKTDAMPELSQQKPEEAKQAEAKPEPGPAESAGKTEAVAVSAASEDFKFIGAVTNIRRKIFTNWNPPVGAKGAKAKVQFTISRSGRVVETRLLEPSSNFYYDQAAIRAIQQSSPFPALPEEFSKQTAVFIVDLVPKD
jgi:protein TonB